MDVKIMASWDLILYLLIILGSTLDFVTSQCAVVEVKNSISDDMNDLYSQTSSSCDTDRRAYRSDRSRSTNRRFYLYYDDNYWLIYVTFCQPEGVLNPLAKVLSNAQYPEQINGTWQEYYSDFPKSYYGHSGLKVACYQQDPRARVSVGIISGITITILCTLCVIIPVIVARVKRGRFVARARRDTEQANTQQREPSGYDHDISTISDGNFQSSQGSFENVILPSYEDVQREKENLGDDPPPPYEEPS